MRRWFVRAPVIVLALGWTVATARPAAAEEIKGRAILDHPCGKVAVQHMGLLKAGRLDEAYQLGTAMLQQQWESVPAEQREGLAKTMKEIAQTESEYSSDIRKFGVLHVDGAKARLDVTKEVDVGAGRGSQTMTQNFEVDATACRIAP